MKLLFRELCPEDGDGNTKGLAFPQGEWRHCWPFKYGGVLLLLSLFSRVWFCTTPKTTALQAPPSLGFSRQEHWSGLPFPSPMHESEKWKVKMKSDCSPPGSSIHGIFQARVLEWGAIAFSTSALSMAIFSALRSSVPKVLTFKKKFTSKSFRDRTWKVCKTSPSGLLILPTSLHSSGCCSHLTFLLGR